MENNQLEGRALEREQSDGRPLRDRGLLLAGTSAARRGVGQGTGIFAGSLMAFSSGFTNAVFACAKRNHFAPRRSSARGIQLRLRLDSERGRKGRKLRREQERSS